jgi:hypothetical protein
MRQLALLFTVVAVASSAAPGRAVDYDKIDRTIGKEPAYSGKPQYALLLFGREAKLRVWAVMDGEILYLDKNADRDLTAKEERFEKLSDVKGVEIADPDGKTRYVVTSVSKYEEEEPSATHLMFFVDVQGPVEYGQYCDVKLAGEAAKTSFAHFHGPLAAGPITVNFAVPKSYALVAGDEPTDLRATVGTISAKHHCWVMVQSHQGVDEYAFAKGVCPEVDVEFPPKTPGDPPIERTYKLEGFC